LAIILLYTGAHTLSYGSWHAAIGPLEIGAALLAIIAYTLLRFARRPMPPLIVGSPRGAHGEAGDTAAMQSRVSHRDLRRRPRDPVPEGQSRRGPQRLRHV